MKLTALFIPQYPNDGYCQIEFDPLKFSIPDKEYELLTCKELEDKILSEEYGKITHVQEDSEPMRPTTEAWDINFDWDWYWATHTIEIDEIIEEESI